MGQLIGNGSSICLLSSILIPYVASGKAREKEEKVNKEKEERKKKRKEMWMDNRVQNVYDKMWSYLQTYSFSVLQQDGQPKTQTAWCKLIDVQEAFDRIYSYWIDINDEVLVMTLQ